jgi:hypothetical protein
LTSPFDPTLTDQQAYVLGAATVLGTMTGIQGRQTAKEVMKVIGNIKTTKFVPTHVNWLEGNVGAVLGGKKAVASVPSNEVKRVSSFGNPLLKEPRLPGGGVSTNAKVENAGLASSKTGSVETIVKKELLPGEGNAGTYGELKKLSVRDGLNLGKAAAARAVVEKGRQAVVKASVVKKVPHPSYVDKQTKGQRGETGGQNPLERMGYDIHPSKLPGGRGIDTVASKSNVKGELVDIIVVESKFRTSGTPKLDKQMTDEWINGNIEKMRRSLDPEVRETGDLLFQNKDLIRRKANLMDETGANNWNKIKLPASKEFK